MSVTTHPMAPHELPGFLPGSDGSDPFFTGVLVFLLVMLMVVGNLYLTLHAIPERMAHKHNNTQLQAITVLAILALFTHNNIFWVLSLLLAVIRFPDLITPINSISDSLELLSGRRSKAKADDFVNDVPSDPPAAPVLDEPNVDAKEA